MKFFESDGVNYRIDMTSNVVYVVETEEPFGVFDSRQEKSIHTTVMRARSIPKTTSKETQKKTK